MNKQCDYEYKQHLAGFVKVNKCVVFCSIVEDDKGFEFCVDDERSLFPLFDNSYNTYDECCNEIMGYLKANKELLKNQRVVGFEINHTVKAFLTYCRALKMEGKCPIRGCCL